MERNNKKDKTYGRVMPRVNSRSRINLKNISNVTRHETSSTVHVGAKPSSSNVSSSVYRELPTVLNDYIPEVPLDKIKKSPSRVKPKKTLKSLNPAASPHSKAKHVEVGNNARNRCVRASAPSLVHPDPVSWSASHLRQCFSSRSHTRLKELKDEIKEFQEREKLMKIRSHLYKKCGVVLDDVGQVAIDKAVQVQAMDNTDDLRCVWLSPYRDLKQFILSYRDALHANGYGNSAPLTNGSAGSPLGRTAGSPPVTGAGAGPSPMAALMSVTDTLPPGSPRSAGGSPPQPPPQRSASRSSQHSPNSSGSNGGRRSSGSRHVSSTTSVSSTEAGEGAEAAAPAPAPLLKCTLCQERLEDTHFVQCPSQPHHKFCFPCSRDSIKRQQGSEVYCPSGEKCPLANSTVPWAFMQGEIATILGEEFKPKKERET